MKYLSRQNVFSLIPYMRTHPKNYSLMSSPAPKCRVTNLIGRDNYLASEEPTNLISSIDKFKLKVEVAVCYNGVPVLVTLFLSDI